MRTVKTPIQAEEAEEGRKGGALGEAITEYGIMLALIAAVVLGLITTLGSNVRDAMHAIVGGLSGGDG